MGDPVRTCDSLGIFWNGEEVTGILVYGLWAGDIVTPPAFPSAMWPADTEVRARRLWGEGWTVWLWEIRIWSWPPDDRWRAVIRGTLEVALLAGADIAWCAVEGCFADPPALFDLATMAEGVWSCRSKGGVRADAPPLGGRFKCIHATSLKCLHGEATRMLGVARYD